MGTHPIFESDFDCLTVQYKMGEKELVEVYDEILNHVGRGTWTSISSLASIIEQIPQKHAPQQEIDNISRRCVKIVTDSKVAREQSSRLGGYGALVLSDSKCQLDGKLNDSKQSELKNDVLEEIRLAKQSLNEYQEDIAKQSVDYLRPNDKIVVWEYNELVASFMHWATNSKSRKMSITLMVTGSSECAKEYTRKFKKQIDSQVLQIVFLGDGGFFSVMPIVQKVIIPVKSLLPDGSVRVPGGVRAVCLAARQHAVPVIGLCPMHKVACEHPMDEIELVKPGRPGEVKPEWDLVKSKLLSLLITESEGALPPSDTYRLHNERY